MKYSTKKQSGLSLVEILVALVISIFLLGGIVQVYLGNRAAYSFSDASSRVQENGRFALDALARDLRMAGFFGCMDLRQGNQLIQNHLDTASDNYDPNRHDFLNQRPIVLTPPPNTGINGSDDIMLMGVKPGQGTVTGTLSLPGSGAFQITNNVSIQPNDAVLLTNCWTSDIFEATNATQTGPDRITVVHTTAAGPNSPGNANINGCPGNSHCLNGGDIPANLDVAYAANNSSIYVLQSVRYSIQASASGSGEPALWRDENNDNQELIEGIERMVVMYGVDTNGDGSPNQYLGSDAVLAADQVVTAVRIWLVVRSDRDNVMDANQTYTVNGVNTVAPDRRLRQVFSATVDLRNR
jgi:type IV pilus assembly protein PilW